jgi:hypothetical protein
MLLQCPAAVQWMPMSFEERESGLLLWHSRYRYHWIVGRNASSLAVEIVSGSKCLGS